MLEVIEAADEAAYAEYRKEGGDVSDTLVRRIRRDMERGRPGTAEKEGGERGREEFGGERPKTRAGSRSPVVEEGDEEEDDTDAELRAMAGLSPKAAVVEPAAEVQDDEEDDDDDLDLDGMLEDVNAGAITFSPKGSRQKLASPEKAAAKAAKAAPAADVHTFACDGVTIKIHATHEGPLAGGEGGTSKYVGLGGIRLVRYDGNFKNVDLRSSSTDATPRDLRSLGYDQDQRCLSNLFEGDAQSTEDGDMWLVPDSITAGVAGADGSVEIR